MLVLPLNNGHNRKDFDCGNVDLNRWFRQVARQHQEKRVSSTFVTLADESSTDILGFYSISLAEVVNADLPEAYQKRLPFKIPVFRLGRLATSLRYQGTGIGEFMLFDAIDRVTRISSEIGGIGLMDDAKESAVAFYRNYGFEPMGDHPHHLVLRI